MTTASAGLRGQVHQRGATYVCVRGARLLVAVGLVPPHIRDLNTSTSQPGEDGS